MPQSPDEPSRRTAVLDSALRTFARFGYRKTSLSELAQAAGISRPTLYSWFDSKEEIFRAAVEQSLSQDLEACERALTDQGQQFPQRVLTAFDCWAGRYVGPMTREIPALLESNPGLLGPIAGTAASRFEQLLVAAIAAAITAEPRAGGAGAVARTLISTSIGIKYQTESRDEYRERMAAAIALIVPTARTIPRG